LGIARRIDSDYHIIDKLSINDLRRKRSGYLGGRLGLHADAGVIELSAGRAAQQALYRPVAAAMAA
jgi:hypothetical protein